MRKVKLFGKAVSPLALVGVFVAVAALVGASVILTSATVTTNNVTVSGTQAIKLTLYDASPDTYYATDSAGVNYGWNIVNPEALSAVTMTITITNTNDTVAMKWSDIGSIKATLTSNGAGNVDLVGYGSSFTTNTLTYKYTLTQSIPAGTYAGTLNIVYNVPGEYHVSASVSGVTA